MNRIALPHRFLRWTLLSLVIAGLLVALPAVDAYVTKPTKTAQNEDGQRSPGAVAPASVLLIPKTRLNTELPSKRYSINVNAQEVAFTLEALGSLGKTQPHQIGVGRQVDQASIGIGKLFINPDGSKVRLMAIRSPGAVALRLHLEQFDLAPGDEVYVYGMAADSYVAGPYTRQGPSSVGKGAGGGAFWTDTIEGDTAIIESYTVGEERPFRLSEVSHFYKGIPGNVEAPNVLSCHNDAMCFADPEKDAVGRITFIENGSSFLCTGTMMNTQAADFPPFFYTAAHCVSTQVVAATVETYWFYRTTSCNSGIVSSSWVRTPSGANLLATQQTADSTLLRILNPVPGNLYYSGWDSGAKGVGTAVFGLSHPSNGLPPSTESYLRRASGSITSTTASCADTGLVNGYNTNWTSGMTEPGSSGSGLWITSAGNDYFIGVLSCGLFPPSCSTRTSWYGKFSDFFPTVQTYLSLGDGTGACTATPISVGQTINGSLVSGDCISRVRGLNHNADRYTFSGTAGQQIAITVTSPTIDTYLYLLSPSKSLAAQDDDGAGDGSTNSRIPASSGFFSLPATGTYAIEVTSFSTSETGNYTLTLTGPTTCSYTVSPPSASFGASGGNGSFTVTTTPSTNCSWTATSDVSWITTSSSGTGSGSASYTVASNPNTGQRTGHVTVQGQIHTVTQAGTTCTYTISPPSASFVASGGNGSITVTTNPTTGCSWTATSDVSWITTSSSGTGSGSASYSVASNPTTSQRTGHVTVQGQVHTVTQAGTTTSCPQVSISTSLTGGPNSTVLVPITVSSLTGLNVVAYDFTLTFNSNVSLANPAFDTSGTLSSAMTITPNTNTPGQITISAFGTTALSGSGTLLNLRLNLGSTAGACSPLNWTSFRFNEGNPCAMTSNGQICITNLSISGTVSYCITPNVKVQGVTLNAAGTPSGSATTAADGTYTIANLGNTNYTVTPSKTGGVNGITSFDASLVAQHAAGLITLTACQQLAGDASNNGSLSSFDASLIAQTVAGISNTGIAGSWKFMPASRPYTPLSGALTGQNYDAVLVGDVSGNWTPAGLANVGPSPSGVSVSLSGLFAVTTDTMSLSIVVDDLSGRGVKSYDLALTYDPTLQLQSPAIGTEGTLSRAMTITANSQAPGRLVISAFGTRSLSGSGTLLNLTFKTAGSKKARPVFALQSFVFNEGVPKAKLVTK